MTSSTFFPETNSTSDIFHPQYTRRQRRRRRRRKLPNTSQALADKKTSSRLEGSRRTTRTHYDQRSPSAGATIGHCSLRPQQERSDSLKGAAARFLWDRLANLGQDCQCQLGGATCHLRTSATAKCCPPSKNDLVTFSEPFPPKFPQNRIDLDYQRNIAIDNKTLPEAQRTQGIASKT